MLDETFFAALYDRTYDARARQDFAFYLPMIMAADTVLDVGCGTGALLHLARDAGHTGRLVGLDPSEHMLARARRRSDIEWVRGDLADVQWQGVFDLAVMTGHAFQQLIGDDDLRTAFAALARALTPAGRFAFETGNPAARGWENWTPEHVAELTDEHGTALRMWHQYDEPVGDVVTYRTTVASDAWDAPRTSSPDTLRFLTVDALTAFVTGAGLVVDDVFGDFDRQPRTDASPEIVAVVRRA